MLFVSKYPQLHSTYLLEDTIFYSPLSMGRVVWGKIKNSVLKNELKSWKVISFFTECPIINKKWLTRHDSFLLLHRCHQLGRYFILFLCNKLGSIFISVSTYQSHHISISTITFVCPLHWSSRIASHRSHRITKHFGQIKMLMLSAMRFYTSIDKKVIFQHDIIFSLLEIPKK